MKLVQTLRCLRLAVVAAFTTIATVANGAALTESTVISPEPYAGELQGLAVSFLARDLETGTDYVLGGSDLDTRHAPFSTFKMPNLLIALETGVAPSLTAWRDWDPAARAVESHWPRSWKEGQTLERAFAHSTVWYFQDLALEIGSPAYRTWLSAWAYGNASVPDYSDDFWLGGTLQISVREQVEFLEALLLRKLAVSDKGLEALHQASLAGEVDGVSLYGKTGAGPDDPTNLGGAFSGWYVGYVKRHEGSPVVFALFVAAPSFASLRDFRKSFSLKLLESVAIIPPGAFQGI
jgi:beta-lactamase class D